MTLEDLRRTKFDFFEGVEKTRNIREDTRSALPVVDPLVFTLVFGVCSHQELTTRQACQGHLESNILKRQDWVGEGRPGDSEAYLLVESSFDPKDLISDLNALEGIEASMDHEGEHYCFVVRWLDSDTLDGQAEVLALFEKHCTLGRDQEFWDRFSPLLRLVGGEWCKEEWVLRGPEGTTELECEVGGEPHIPRIPQVGETGPLRILVDPPQVEDLRQGFFRKVFREAIAPMMAGEGYEVQRTRMCGIPASAVDLGWIQSRAESYWRENVPRGAPVYTFAIRLRNEIGRVLVRPKEVQVEVKHGLSVYLDVLIRTKDDHGYYQYEFSISAPRG